MSAIERVKAAVFQHSITSNHIWQDIAALVARVEKLEAALGDIDQENRITEGSPGPLYSAGFVAG